MLYQVFRLVQTQGMRLFVATGRKTDSLPRAIARAAKCNGQVRPYGSLTVLYTCGVQVTGRPAIAPQRAYWPEPTRIVQIKPRIVNAQGLSVHSSDLHEPCPRVERERSARKLSSFERERSARKLSSFERY